MILYRYEDKSARDSDVSANVTKNKNKNKKNVGLESQSNAGDLSPFGLTHSNIRS